MLTRQRLLLMATTMVIVACGGGKPATTSHKGRYERPPLAETTDQRLKQEALMIEAKMDMETGHEEAAEKIYRRLATSQHAAAYELSRILSDNGDKDSAIVYALAACNGDKNNTWYMLHLAELYRETNQTKQLITTWSAIVDKNPDKLDYYYELSNAYLRADDIRNAIATLNRVEKRVGVTEPVSLQKAKLWSHAGNEDKAMQELENLAKSMPQETRYNGILAEQYMSSGNYAKAKECYDRILANDPDDEFVHISLAEYYKAIKQPRKAYEELRIAMSQKNLTTSNKLKILTTFYSSEEFYGIHSSYTFDLLEVAMRNCDDTVSFAAFYGDALMRQRKFKEAAHQFEIYLTSDSGRYDVWEALLICEMSADGDTATMADHARRASRLFPLHNLPYYVQAVVLHDNKEYLQAIDLLAKCEKMGFEKGYLEPETYSLMAECYNRMDDKRSYDYYEKYLKMRPNDIMALNSYAYRLALDNLELDKARQMSGRTIKAEPENPFYLDTYAWILHQMGNDSEALDYIEKALRHYDSFGGPSDEVMRHYEAIKKGAGR